MSLTASCKFQEEFLLFIWEAVPGPGKNLICCSSAELRLRCCPDVPR